LGSRHCFLCPLSHWLPKRQLLYDPLCICHMLVNTMTVLGSQLVSSKFSSQHQKPLRLLNR
jgi:hypothetical protein